MISLPGNTPHVTAFGLSESQLARFISPLINKHKSNKTLSTRNSQVHLYTYRLVNNLVVDSCLLLQPVDGAYQVEHILTLHEELQIGLLIDVAVRRSPAVYLVVTGLTVHIRLRVYGQNAHLVQSTQLTCKKVSLRGQLVLTPWKRLDLKSSSFKLSYCPRQEVRIVSLQHGRSC